MGAGLAGEGAIGTSSMAPGYLAGSAAATAALGVGFVAAFAALMNAYGPQISDMIGGSTHLGINPFTDEVVGGMQFRGPVKTVLANLGMSGSYGDEVARLNEMIPDTATLAARFTAETGITPPNSLAEASTVANQFQSWLFSQPEIQSADRWLRQYYWDKGMKETGGNPVTYGAEGAIVDEPMVATGLRTGRKLVMGERGPEALVPMSGKFNPEKEFYDRKYQQQVARNMFDINTMDWVPRR